MLIRKNKNDAIPNQLLEEDGAFPIYIFTCKQAVLVNGDPQYVVIREIDESESETEPKD